MRTFSSCPIGIYQREEVALSKKHYLTTIGWIIQIEQNALPKYVQTTYRHNMSRVLFGLGNRWIFSVSNLQNVCNILK